MSAEHKWLKTLSAGIGSTSDYITIYGWLDNDLSVGFQTRSRRWTTTPKRPTIVSGDHTTSKKLTYPAIRRLNVQFLITDTVRKSN